MRPFLQSGRAEERRHRRLRSAVQRRRAAAQRDRGRVVQDPEEAVPREPGLVRRGALHRRPGQGAVSRGTGPDRVGTQIRRSRRVDQRVS